MERWAGKTAVVTGASAGIGAAVCVALADAGLRVVGLARRAHLVTELSSRVRGAGGVSGCACDVSRADQVAAVFGRLEGEGGVDLLVNNAGIFKQGHITEAGGAELALSEEAVLDTLGVNLTGAVLCARHAVGSMARRGVPGHVVNINSIAGHYVPFSPLFNVYSASKHGMTAFSQALAAELAAAGSRVKVTSVSPGLVATDMTAGATHLVDFSPLQPRDVADAVLYAVSSPPHVNITELTIQPVGEKRL